MLDAALWHIKGKPQGPQSPASRPLIARAAEPPKRLLSVRIFGERRLDHVDAKSRASWQIDVAVPDDEWLAQHRPREGFERHVEVSVQEVGHDGTRLDRR